MAGPVAHRHHINSWANSRNCRGARYHSQPGIGALKNVASHQSDELRRSVAVEDGDAPLAGDCGSDYFAAKEGQVEATALDRPRVNASYVRGAEFDGTCRRRERVAISNLLRLASFGRRRVLGGRSVLSGAGNEGCAHGLR